jgi:hypothetical protein
MHDEMLERRLRATLRDDARQLPFTITAAELERRLVLRDRSLGGRRLGLLLAAAVGIGLFGIGGAMGGLFDAPIPSLPTPSPVAEATGPVPATTPPLPLTLPSLDEMIATAGPGSVILAQSHGVADEASLPTGFQERRSWVVLGNIAADSDYEISVACLASRDLELDVRVPLSGGPVGPTGPSFKCDGTVHVAPARYPQERQFGLTAIGQASWRVVVRRLGGDGLLPGDEPAILELVEGREALARLDTHTMDNGPRLPEARGLAYTHAADLPAREGYYVQVSCVGGRILRYIFGDEVGGELVAGTTTQVPCDGASHDSNLSITQPFGSRVFVAAEPGMRWSLLVSGDPPPVSLVHSQPGWQLSSGFGPNLEFETIVQSFTGLGQEGGGPVLIAVSCAGTGTIEVVVRLERANQGQVTEDTYAQFDAACHPDGATTSQSFTNADEYVDVEWTTPAGTWVAVGILVPDPLPSRR